MGILNATPDSFSDGGQFVDVYAALTHAQDMLADGVDIIDIGGESTRPGAEPVSSDEQIKRVIPIISGIREQVSKDVLISIDTTRRAVAEAALNAGANWINDVSGGTEDPAILDLAAQANVPIILMHRLGVSKTMQDQPYYEDVVSEVKLVLQACINNALAAGIKQQHIVIDPGIGFGKRKVDNLDLLANLETFVAMGYPVLLGTSRKRFMGNICTINEPTELVTATAVTTAIGVMAGVHLFRVHDIKENRQALEVAYAIQQRRDRQGQA
jgi:dihydropteroate synthase